MKLLWVPCLALALVSGRSVTPAHARNANVSKTQEIEDHVTAASLDAAVAHMTPDPERSFHIRDIQFVRGDVKIYLNEGSISFLTPIAGKTIAAVFSTEAVEAGDAEVIVLPPQRNERAALAAFTKSPNLDEHFNAALFLFTDNTARELMSAINDRPVRKAPGYATQIAAATDTLARSIGPDMRNRLVAGLLDDHNPEQGFFYGAIGGKTLGTFDVSYNPIDPEQVIIGREGSNSFSLWSSFRARGTGSFRQPETRVSRYRIAADIQSDLSLKADAVMNWNATGANGRVIPLHIADKLHIDSAQIDAQPAEVLQSQGITYGVGDKEDPVYLISNGVIAPGTHELRIGYHGSVVRKTSDGSYFVDDRNAWYPFTRPIRAIFDLTFRCSANLRLVSTGDLVSDDVKGDTRTVHRVTHIPEALAGFNLGDYNVTSEDHGGYHIESYSNKAADAKADITKETAALLDFYSKQWMPLPIHSIAVSPVPAAFGQGFPGLIYLSDLSYLPSESRPLTLQTAEYERFFSDLLLPHEVAHQWWGNLVTAADYRSGWIMEALANYSALQFMKQTRGSGEVDKVLDQYRSNLARVENGKAIETYGPLEFGTRLVDLANANVWHAILYEKGTWVIHMLHQRLGDEAFLKLETTLLHDYADRPITNEDFRRAASALLPPRQPDKNLSSFFDTWVYGTGIPKMQYRGGEITLSGVDDDFTADVPLRCRSKQKSLDIRWIRLDSGTNALDLPPGDSCQLPSSSEFLYNPAS